MLAATHQTWLRDPATGNYLLDVFREPHDGDTWICRRDETIRLPYRDIIHHTQDGIPYLAPELVLLFKAKHARPKDQATARPRSRLPALLAVELQCGRCGRGCHHRTGVTTAVLGAIGGVDVGGDLGRRVADVLDGDIGLQTRHADTGPA